MGNDVLWKSLVVSSIVFFIISAFMMYVIVGNWTERLSSIESSSLQRQEQIVTTTSRIDLMQGLISQNNVRVTSMEQRMNDIEHRMNELEKAMKKNKTSMSRGSIDSNALGTR